MAELDDLLALLPDNDSGEISAADMRTIVTEMWTESATLFAAAEALILDLQTRMDAIEAGGQSVTVTGRWQIVPTPGAMPGGQQVACDTGNFGTAQLLRFATVDQNNVDMTSVLLNATEVYGQEDTDSANWVHYNVAASPVQDGTWVDMPVTVAGFGGTSDAAQWQSGRFVFTIPNAAVAA